MKDANALFPTDGDASTPWVRGATLDAVNPTAALAALFRKERVGLVKLAFLLTGSQATAEDVVQDAFANTQPKMADVDNPGGYLRTAVVNGARSIMRREKNAPALGQPMTATLDTRTIELFDSLRGLSERRRTAVVLRYWQDLTIDQIAEIMDCKAGTVSSLLHRALNDLRKELGPDA